MNADQFPSTQSADLAAAVPGSSSVPASASFRDTSLGDFLRPSKRSRDESEEDSPAAANAAAAAAAAANANASASMAASAAGKASGAAAGPTAAAAAIEGDTASLSLGQRSPASHAGAGAAGTASEHDEDMDSVHVVDAAPVKPPSWHVRARGLQDFVPDLRESLNSKLAKLKREFDDLLQLQHDLKSKRPDGVAIAKAVSTQLETFVSTSVRQACPFADGNAALLRRRALIVEAVDTISAMHDMAMQQTARRVDNFVLNATHQLLQIVTDLALSGRTPDPDNNTYSPVREGDPPQLDAFLNRMTTQLFTAPPSVSLRDYLTVAVQHTTTTVTARLEKLWADKEKFRQQKSARQPADATATDATASAAPSDTAGSTAPESEDVDFHQRDGRERRDESGSRRRRKSKRSTRTNPSRTPSRQARAAPTTPTATAAPDPATPRRQQSGERQPSTRPQGRRPQQQQPPHTDTTPAPTLEGLAAQLQQLQQLLSTRTATPRRRAAEQRRHADASDSDDNDDDNTSTWQQHTPRQSNQRGRGRPWRSRGRGRGGRHTTDRSSW